MYSKIRKLHFIGIGGIGMSGIAEVLLNLGYRISGSDISNSHTIQRLQRMGAEIHLGHEAHHVEGANAVVYSSAVKNDNPELRAARLARIPVVARAEMLAELMRLKYGIAIAGTHGKTTTTSLIATVLGHAKMDPTVVNGGIVKSFGSNAYLGKGEFLVTEADESDGSFLKLNPTIAIITNMDPEHMEHYGTFSAVRSAYLNFAGKVPFYGLAVLCMDHPEVQALAAQLPDKRVITYGLKAAPQVSGDASGPTNGVHDGPNYQAVAIHQKGIHTCFDVLFCDPTTKEKQNLGQIQLSLPGRHNVANTLAAIAVARELLIPWGIITYAFKNFQGVQRRFDLIQNSPERVVIDDYAHHPTEIQATLEAVRSASYQSDGGIETMTDRRRLVVIFQPHRYSRIQTLMQDFFRCFHQADLVLVEPIYPAGEKPLSGLEGESGQRLLMEGIRQHSQTQAAPMPTGPMWSDELEAMLQPGDVVAFLGAGDITYRARSFGVKTLGGREPPPNPPTLFF
ncbi:MAG: UDP-N-acetylmuramate--L-alanine ligase [Magnetococcus sp. DMHC-6]